MCPSLKLSTPLPLGSGKFGSPWERMHSAYLIPDEYPLDVELLGFREEPQAAIVTAHAIALSRISTHVLLGLTTPTL